MHPAAVHAQIHEMVAAGLNDCEIARRVQIPRSTVRDIRRRRTDSPPRAFCPRCWDRARQMRFTADEYCELLGLYLGDGCVSRAARTSSLRIALDGAYPGLVDRTRGLLQRCMNGRPVQIVRAPDSNVRVVQAHSRHWSCLFPQHGPGPKHERAIVMEGWQRSLIEVAPWSLLRGLIYSDGCRFPNRTGKYVYWSYGFSNSSTDILDLFCSTCEAVGVRFRCYSNAVRINGRPDVALLDEHVGPKY